MFQFVFKTLEQTSQFTRLEVGNGEKIKFWTDLWIGDACLKDKFPTLFNCSSKKDGSIAEFHSNTGWQPSFRRNLNDGR